MRLTDLEKQHLLSAAGYQCEYCKRNLIDVQYEIDHIVPKALGGSDSMGNYAIACPRCNRNKGHRTHFIDHHTHELAKLFHPRRMKWSDHLSVQNNEIVGITPEGRATCALLMRATPQYAPPDLQWDYLEGVEGNQELYMFLNHLRFRRLQNEFRILEDLLTNPLPSVNASEEEVRISNSVRRMLLLELMFTRSQKVDINKGISLGEQILSQESDSLIDIRNVLSILYQQRATVRYLSGDLVGARSDQKRSFYHYSHIQLPEDELQLDKYNPSDLRMYLRKITIRYKFDPIDWPQNHLHDLVHLSLDLSDPGSLVYFNYLTDTVLIQRESDYKLLETLYGILTEVLETGGYGSRIDHAGLVTLRRRWWVLHCILEDEAWFDALLADLKYWMKIEMFNEVRELRSYIERIHERINRETYEEVMRVFRLVDRNTAGTKEDPSA